MDITVKHIGSFGGRPASIVECKFSYNGASIEFDATDLSGRVDNDFITRLRDVANELEEHNDKIDNA